MLTQENPPSTQNEAGGTSPDIANHSILPQPEGSYTCALREPQVSPQDDVKSERQDSGVCDLTEDPNHWPDSHSDNTDDHKHTSPKDESGSHGNMYQGSSSSSSCGSPRGYPSSPRIYQEQPLKDGVSPRQPVYPQPLSSLVSLARSPAGATFHSELFSAAPHTGTPGHHSNSSNGSQDKTEENGLRGDLYYCHLCTYIGVTKHEFNNHMSTHFDHQCPYCDYTSRTEGRLKRHIKDFHSEDTEHSRRDPGKPKILRCRQCDFASEDKFEFWNHQRNHIKDDKALHCPKCPFVTEYKHHLEYHLRNHFGSKPFKCPKCNYSCVNKSMLNSHMKSHTNVYQYRCADCTYATKYCHSLKLHLKKYNHKPATVLNPDGSLPTDGSGDFELMSKRGPPRGPRGPRKDKSPPPGFAPSMPSLSNPLLPAGIMPPQPFWPLGAGMGMHPGAGFFQTPPPLIPGSGMSPFSLPMTHRSLPFFPAPEQARPEKSEEDGRFHCFLCDYSSSSQQRLMTHHLKVHPLHHQDLLRMYSMPPEMTNPLLPDIHIKQESDSPFREQPPSSMEMTKMWAMMAATATANAQCSPQGEPMKRITDVVHLQPEPQANGERPLDLTKSGNTNDQSTAHKELLLGKRKLVDVMDEQASSAIQTAEANTAVSSPRKRSRKGKAYKLDNMCLMLHEKAQSEDEDCFNSEEDCESDYTGSGDHLTNSLPQQNSVTTSTPAHGHSDRLDSHIQSPSPVNCDTKNPDTTQEPTDMSQDDMAAVNMLLSSAMNQKKLLAVSRRLEPHFDTSVTGMEKEDHPHSGIPTEVIMAEVQNGNGNYECCHCGIAFRDCVMYTVHMGYHGYKDPFKCNMCGHEAKNKVEFFLHIARAAHE